MLLFKVGKTFRVSGRGYILSSGYNKTIVSDGGVKMKIGDKVMLLFPDRSSAVTEIKGINFRAPYDILIDFTDDVPIETEVWLI
jgi:hypothetical protein